MGELAGLVELGKTVGVPGLLFGLIYLYMLTDRKKFEQILQQHKEERDRDFEHLTEQMNFLHGQHQALTMMSTTLEALRNLVVDLKKGVDQFPGMARDIHGRIDMLIAEEKKKHA